MSNISDLSEYEEICVAGGASEGQCVATMTGLGAIGGALGLSYLGPAGMWEGAELGAWLGGSMGGMFCSPMGFMS